MCVEDVVVSLSTTDDDDSEMMVQLSLYRMNKRNAIVLIFAALYAYAYIHVLSSIGQLCVLFSSVCNQI